MLNFFFFFVQSAELGVLSCCTFPLFFVRDSFLSAQSAELKVSILWRLMSILFSYMLAEGLGLSGIVSILFTGMVSENLLVFFFFFLV